MFGSKKPNDNVYTVLNTELERCHGLLHKCKDGSEAQTGAWAMIRKFQGALIEALKKQPNDAKAIKDLQDSVADLYLTGTDSKDD